MDLLNEDAQQRARGRRIRNITHTNTVTTVYEEGGGRPSSPELKIHHGVAHGTSSAVFEKRLTRSEST